MTQKMNTGKYNNKEPAIAVAIISTISVLFVVASSALTSPVFALGHWHEGDKMESSSEEEEDNTNVSTDNSESQVNQEDTEDNRSISDNDAISVSDDDPENSNTPLNFIGKGNSDMEDSAQSDDVNENDE